MECDSASVWFSPKLAAWVITSNGGSDITLLYANGVILYPDGSRLNAAQERNAVRLFPDGVDDADSPTMP